MLYLGGVGGGVALLDRGQHVRQQLVEALTHDLPVGVVGGHVPPAGEGSPSHVATLVVADAAYELPHAGEDVAHGAHVVPRVVTGQRERSLDDVVVGDRGTYLITWARL